MRRLTKDEKLNSLRRAIAGTLPAPRHLFGAALRDAFVASGSITPVGMRTADVFETDDIGRREAAETIFFDEAHDPEVLPAVLDDVTTDPGVYEHLVYLKILRAATTKEAGEELARIRATHQYKRRVWRELYPYANEIPRDDAPAHRPLAPASWGSQ